MENDKGTDNEKELTSTSNSDMDKLLSTNKDEKSDSNDTLPTSSTDASTSFKSTHLVSDDPISSTSSEMDAIRSKQLVIQSDKSTLPGFNPEAELLEMSVTKPEKIEENVDDLVNDLETLLGGSTEEFQMPFKGAKETTEDENSEPNEKNLLENEVSSNTAVDKEPSAEPSSALTEKVSESDNKIPDEDTETTTVSSINKTESKEYDKNSDTVKENEALVIENVITTAVEEDKDIINPTTKSDSSATENIEIEIVTVSSVEGTKVDSEKVSTSITGDSSAEEHSSNENNCGNNSIIEESVDETNDENHVSGQKVKCTETNIDDKNEKVTKDEENGTKIETVHGIEEKTDDVKETKTSMQMSDESANVLKEVIKNACDSVVSIEPSEETNESLIETKLENKVQERDMEANDDIVEHKNEQVSSEQNEAKVEVVQCNAEQDIKEEINKNAEENITTKESYIENESEREVQERDMERNDDIIEDKNEQVSSKHNETKMKDSQRNADQNITDIEADHDIKEEIESDAKDTNIVDKSKQSTSDILKEANEDSSETTATNESMFKSESEKDQVINNDKTTTDTTIDESSEETTGEHTLEVHSNDSHEEDSDSATSGNKSNVDSCQDEEDPKDDSKDIEHDPNIESHEICKDEQETKDSYMKDNQSVTDSGENVVVNENDSSSTKIIKPDKFDKEEVTITIEFKQKADEAEEQKNDEIGNKETNIDVKENKNSDECTTKDNTENNIDLTTPNNSDKCHEIDTTKKTTLDNQGTLSNTTQLLTNDTLSQDKTEIVNIEKSVTPTNSNIDTDDTNEQYTFNIGEDVSEDDADGVVNKRENGSEDSEEPETEVIESTNQQEDLAASSVTESLKEGTISDNIMEPVSDDLGHAKDLGETIKVDKKTDDQEGDAIEIDIDDKNVIDPELNVEREELVKNKESVILSSKQEDMEITNTSEENMETLKESMEVEISDNISLEDKDAITTTDKNKVDKTSVSETLSEDTSVPDLPQSSNLEEQKTEITDTESITQEPLDSLNVEQDKTKTTDIESTEQEIPDGSNLTEDQTKVIDQEPIVEEPEVVAPPKEQIQDDGIVEVTEAQIEKEHLEEDKVIPVISEDVKDSDASKTNESLKIVEMQNELISGSKSNENKQDEVCIETKKTEDTTEIEALAATDVKDQTFKSDHVVEIESKTESSQKEIKLPEILTVEERKPISEINIRRKTVEQDLEKIVCLSEESSDSDSIELSLSKVEVLDDIDHTEISKSMPLSDDQVSTSSIIGQEQVIHDVSLTEESQPNQEETDLIQIAKEVEQLENDDGIEPTSEIPSEESMPGIDEVLSQQPLPKIQDDSSILSLGKISSDHLKHNQDERKLSDKELREIEAIRAAVASITDSSQDTYDSYLVESSVTIENSIPEVSSDVPECDVQDVSSNSQSTSEPILIEDTSTALSISSTEIQGSPQERDELKTEKDKGKTNDATTPTLAIKEETIGNSLQNDIKNNISQSCEVTPVSPSKGKEDTKVMPSAVDSIDKEIIKEAILEAAMSGSEENDDTEADTISNEKPVKTKGRKTTKISEPLSINIEDVEREKVYSPKITIKPLKVPDDEVSTTSDAEVNKGSLKMTITKQSDTMHSILKVVEAEDDCEVESNQGDSIPKLVIKPKIQQSEQQHSPKISSRASKVYSPTSTQRCGSPRVTIKLASDPKSDSPRKITFKPVVKPEEAPKRHSPRDQEQKNHNPKITIKPIPKPPEQEKEDTLPITPKVTIKPIKRHAEDEPDLDQERSSPKITIKPVIRPIEESDQSNQVTPRLIIKPIKKQDDEIKEPEQGRSSPKISIKPVIKPPELEIDEEIEEVKERIVLKINKGNLPTPVKDKKREYVEDDKLEKLGKIKLKFSTSGGHPHIVQEGDESNKRLKKDNVHSGTPVHKNDDISNKRPLEEKQPEKNKKLRTSPTPDKDNNIENRLTDQKPNLAVSIEETKEQVVADIKVEKMSLTPNISKIADLASRTTHIEANSVVTVGIATPTVTPTPKKRGRPRKVPLEIRPELSDSPLPTSGFGSASSPSSTSSTPDGSSTGGRPKRSCRGQNVIAALGIKPRKPRGRGRGSKVNMGDRMPILTAPVEPIQRVPMKPEKVKNKNKKKKKKSRSRSKSK